ncbi:MAG TPA: hypothetical protein ENK31_01175 [Nannocystis exedens]|nr:hypothetical protein [Nannocystis exedens]
MEEGVQDAWAQSLSEIFKEVIRKLPDSTTLGELVAAAKSSEQIAPVLKVFSVQELIDVAKTRPRQEPKPPPPRENVQFDTDGNPIMDLADSGPAVIRRRADVENGDILVLQALHKNRTGRRESELLQITGLTSEQLRLIVRHLRAKSFIHIEGSGSKRRFKITRSGSGYLRKNSY